MSELRFLRLAFFAPIALPLVACTPVWLFRPLGYHLPDWFVTVFGFLAASLLYGGLPYILFLFWVFRSRRAETLAAAVWASFVAPLVVACLVAIEIGVWMIAKEPTLESVQNAVPTGLFVSLFTVGFGYAYVLVVNGLRVGLRSLGALRSGAV